MATLIVKPNFNRKENMLTLPASSLNMFAEAEVQDNTGFYQRQFGVFGYMRLTNKMKFILHSLKGVPFLWQPHKSCGWDPIGGMYTGRQELTPCEGKINSEYCIDEMFDGCFKHLLQWNGTGPLQLDATGTALINKMIEVLTTNAILGAHLTLTVGKLYDPASVDFTTKTPGDIRSMFTKTIGTCKGWLELLKEMALASADHDHLNISGLLPAGSFDGKKFTGDVVALYDATFDAAPAPLQTLVNEGGIGGFSDSFSALWLVSTSIYNKVAQEYRELCISVNCVNPRITRQSFTVQTTRGSREQHVYFIDDTPVIPISIVNQVDQYLTGAMHFAYLTAAGNITLGSAFTTIDALDVQGNSNAGIAIQRDTNLNRLGMYYFSANNLFQTHIADTDYIAGSQAYMVPA